jgi:hypothetical protein
MTFTLPWSKIWLERCRYPSRRERLVQTGNGLEDDYPWRSGRCVILRAPFTVQAVAVGIWTGSQPQRTINGVPSLLFPNRDPWTGDFGVVEEESRRADSSARQRT